MSLIGSAQTSYAAQALQVFANYDQLRLQSYCEGESLHSRIHTLSIGDSHLLRFDDVGYFNRIYAGNEEAADRLDEVERFYRGSPFACELITEDDDAAQEWSSRLRRRRGWSRGKCYTWLTAPTDDMAAPEPPESLVVHEISRRSGARAQTCFLDTYLCAFEAEPSRFPAAIRNMRHLFQHDCLRFLLASHDGFPVGVGMVYSDGEWASFCAGATIPKFRNRGCHHALLEARVRILRAAGCPNVCSWAATGSQSQHHMMQAGLTIAGVTTAWVFRPA